MVEVVTKKYIIFVVTPIKNTRFHIKSRVFIYKIKKVARVVVLYTNSKVIIIFYNYY
jgi:hypothetical protein